MKRSALIIGGSMSGLFAAAFLRQFGWEVDVYGRSRVELVGRGAGIPLIPSCSMPSKNAVPGRVTSASQ
jgi:2-polyprenyl-6-methoxyphenol hydroxylase-like FAD-dependent oxidoreductase